MTYSSSIPGRIWAVLGGLLFTAIAAIATPLILHEVGVRSNQQDILFASAIAAAVIGVALTGVRVLVTGPVTIRTTPTTVELHRRGRIRENWTRTETSFSSFVERQSTNGIRTGTIRKLIATTATERVEVVCTWFDAATFNALIADVAPLVPSTPQARFTAPSVSSGTFVIDRRPSKLIVRIALLAVAMAVLAGVSVFIVHDMDPVLSMATIATVAAAIAVLLTAAFALPLLRRERAIPRSISVSQSTLQFNDRVFAVGQLSGIVATPATYTDTRRMIRLTDTNGRATVVPLGHSSDKSFPGYADFLEAIRASTTHRPGIFTLAVA